MDKLKAAVTDVPSFRVRLSRLDMFVHPKSCTIILEPESEPSNALSQVQKRIETIFPHCAVQTQRGDDATFHAHCSMGQTKNKSSASTLIDQYQSNWDTIEFTVDQLVVLTRKPKWSGDTSEDGPEDSFHVTYTIPLGTSPLIAHQPPIPYVAVAPPRAPVKGTTAAATASGEEKVVKIAPVKPRKGGSGEDGAAWITFPTYRNDTTTVSKSL
jgi:hypothetical protein